MVYTHTFINTAQSVTGVSMTAAAPYTHSYTTQGKIYRPQGSPYIKAAPLDSNEYSLKVGEEVIKALLSVFFFGTVKGASTEP